VFAVELTHNHGRLCKSHGLKCARYSRKRARHGPVSNFHDQD